MEQRGQNSASDMVEWRVSRVRVLFALLVIVGLFSGAGVAMLFKNVAAGGSIAMLAIFIAILIAVDMRYKSIRADAAGVAFTGWWVRSRFVPREHIRGVLPTRSRFDSLRLVVRDSRRPLGLECDLLTTDTKDAHEVVRAIFGDAPLHGDLQPQSPGVMDVWARLERGETFSWRHRYASMIGMLGIAAIVATALLLVTIPFWLPWLIGSSVTGVSMLPVTYAVMVIASLAMLTCLDMLRGGPVVRIRAGCGGLTVIRWWRTESYPSAILQAEAVFTQTKAIVVRVRANTKPIKRTWLLAEKQWHTPRGQLAAVMLRLFGKRDLGNNAADPDATKAGTGTSTSPIVT